VDGEMETKRNDFPGRDAERERERYVPVIILGGMADYSGLEYKSTRIY